MFCFIAHSFGGLPIEILGAFLLLLKKKFNFLQKFLAKYFAVLKKRIIFVL